MKRFFVIFFILLFTGCQQADLHHGLTEIEAAEILNLLHENDITAEKEKEVSGQEVSWKVSAFSGQIARARQILISNNLPRKRELGLSGVYKEKGLIPTPDEQKARFLLALKGEIINSLLKVPGVVDADVVLNVPSEDEFSDLSVSERRPTASVVVKTRPGDGTSVPLTEGKVQRFVANSVPNLSEHDVAVIVTRTDLPPNKPLAGMRVPPSSSAAPSSVELLGIRVERGSAGRVRFYFVALLSLLIVVAVALLVNIVRLNRMRVRFQAGTPVDGVPIEGGKRSLLPGESEGVEGTFDVGKRGRT